MEVFIHNLPTEVDFTPEGLAIQLQPFMHSLGIGDDDYHCDKPRRKRHGFITFLNRRDGNKFLRAHGQIPDPLGRPSKNMSRMTLQGAQVYCQQSQKAPDPITIRGLAAAATARQKTDVAKDQASTSVSVTKPVPESGLDSDHAVSFETRSLECGHYGYTQGETLTFFSEVTLCEAGTARFANKNFVIKSPADSKHISIPLNTIMELVWSPKGWITITLSTAPHLFSSDALETLMAALELNSNPTATAARVRLTALNEKHAKVTGTCLVYHMMVVPDNMHVKMRKLDARKTLTISKFDAIIRADPGQELGGDMSYLLDELNRLLNDFSRRGSLSFGILFQLQSLVYNGYLHPKTVIALAKQLRQQARADKMAGMQSLSVDAMRRLVGAIDWPSPHGNPEHFKVEALVDYLNKAERAIRDGAIIEDDAIVGQSLAKINRVNVMPSRITLHGPELESMNRILRKFPNHHDYFLRVQFCDENGEDLRFNPKISYEKIYDRFKTVMKRGVSIAGRTYTFLGWSHSSLRSRSMWFVAPFMDDAGNLQTFFTIIQGLGNFDGIRSPAKCAARIGQAFSETPFFLPLDDEDITILQIADVVSSDGSRVFSDGVGTLSSLAVEAIWDRLPESKSNPTCFQIRHGGSKGMLALDVRLKGREIRLRPSMTKFQSDDTRNLEICDMASKPIPLYLNRQMIKILEDIGVREDWFLSLQQHALADIRGTTVSAQTTAKFLERQSVADCVKLHRLVRLSDRQGFDYRREPFLRSVVETLLLRELRMLKHKARIPVRQGITLFGIMDETDFLREGQVYVTSDPRKDSSGHTIATAPFRRLIVTRSPALHPGDIQLAWNVQPPAGHPLLELQNCIVFSSRGRRDLPSQLSGGDLDGDIYNVIWDDAALMGEPPALRPMEPADYARPTPVDIGHKVERDDMADFFVNFMKTDQLGVIAIRHMILADQREAGTCDKDCVTLAEMHSTAVDFSKTGIPVDMRRLPRYNAFRPDFLAPGPITRLHGKDQIDLEQYIIPLKPDLDDDEAPTHKYYVSEKVLGKLYRAVDERNVWSSDIQTAAAAVGPPFWDSFRYWAAAECRGFGINGTAGFSDQVWEEAKRIESAYEDAMRAAMYDFSEHPVHPLSELEVFIGYIINKTGIQTRRQQDASRKLRDEFDRIATWTIKQIRSGSSFQTRAVRYEAEDGKNLQRCIACVFIADRAGAAPRRPLPARQAEHLQSFQVVAASALMQEVEMWNVVG